MPSFNRSIALAGLVALAACTPEIAQDTVPAVIVANFDPGATVPVVPTPNDLAMDPATGLVNIPIDPTSSAANQEFTRDYLNTLDGFPSSATATTSFSGGLDPATLSADTVKILDLSNGSTLTGATLSFSAETKVLSIAPPTAGWPLATKIAIAVRGGELGAKGKEGEMVVGSEAWALIRSANPLIACPQPDSTVGCKATTSLIPATSTDPEAAAAERAVTAMKLEPLRLGYKKPLDLLESSGIPRAEVAILWVFSTVKQNLNVYDPAGSTPIIPFPNDLVLDRSGATPKVKLPIPAGASTTMQALLAGLNTLDGFSTTAHIVSENSDSLAAFLRPVDVTSVTAADVLVLNLTDPTKPPKVKVCVNCDTYATSSTANPQQLQIVPLEPLRPNSRYAVVVTNGIKDGATQKPTNASTTFALQRLANPLVVNGKASLSSLTDAQAAQLEPLRAAMKPFFDGLAAANIQRKQVTLAWSFTTQSTTKPLEQLRALPTVFDLSSGGALPVTVTGAQYIPAAAFPYWGAVPHANIRGLIIGSIKIPLLLDTVGSKAFKASGVPTPTDVNFTMTLPNIGGTTPTAVPVTLFGHGLQGGRSHGLGIADALAATGHAMIAIDSMWHGDRTSCVTDPAIRSFLGTGCFSGTCNATTGACDGGALACGTPAVACSPGMIPNVSGWNYVDVQNLFATRDNLRQQVIDLAQIVRVLQAPSTLIGSLAAYVDTVTQGSTTEPVLSLDAGKLSYIGQSLGGIQGALFSSVSPEIKASVLNVPGGGLVDVIETAPAFARVKAGMDGVLGSQGMARGTTAYDAFIAIARWIVDPADPINFGRTLINEKNTDLLAAGAMLPDKKIFISWIGGDTVIPNPTTQALIDVSKPAAASLLWQEIKYTSGAPATDRHGFLLNGIDVTPTGQLDAVLWVK